VTRTLVNYQITQFPNYSIFPFSMRVLIPTPLYSYTGSRSEVEAEGATLDQLLRDLDRRYPGIRFRMIDEQDRVRPHMRIFVNGEMAAGLDQRIAAGDEVQILQSLSGG